MRLISNQSTLSFALMGMLLGLPVTSLAQCCQSKDAAASEESLKARTLAAGQNEQAIRHLESAFRQLGMQPPFEGAAENKMKSFRQTLPGAAGDSLMDNVAAILPGKGKLASEWVIMSMHYDEMSGLADRLSRAYGNAPSDAQLRSILLVGFAPDHERMGSRHFVKDAPVPLSSLYAMVHFDAISRFREGSLRLDGVVSSPEFTGLLAPILQSAAVQISSESGRPSSDHASFLEVGVPALSFSIERSHAKDAAPNGSATSINPDQILALAERVCLVLASSESELSFSDQAVKWSSWCAGTSTIPGADKETNPKPCAPECCKKQKESSSQEAPKGKCCG